MSNFVFHEEYIIDIPQERLAEFEHYIISYGLYSQQPVLKGFELSFWNTIKRRIDTDKNYYDVTCLKRKIAAIRSRQQHDKATENDIKNLELYTRELEEKTRDNLVLNETYELNEKSRVKLTDSPYDTDLNSDIGIDTDCDIDIDSKSEVTAHTPSTQNYSKIIFDLFTNAGLPNARNNEISFLQTDFNNAIKYLHSTPEYSHIHSDDVIGAVKNYIEVLTSSKTYYNVKLNFFKLVQSKKFYDFLPANYDFNNFLKFDSKDSPEETKKPISPYLLKVCPVCKQKAMYTVHTGGNFDDYHCNSCNKTYTYKELYANG